ncbi:hypothetical protein LEN26_016206 [Aphanomyces euteiches]|nr:hypothetical protein LEN26_016206 [Aphanomyces euteiches]KAH9106355.1 hypothetical protein AeMF1_018017 [Aphanomyces euteiches]
MRLALVLLFLLSTTALANTCGGNFLATSTEAGCALGRCSCWSYISTCSATELCEDATALDGTPLCQGLCTLTPLGITLKVVQWLFIGGCPLAILIHHLYQKRRQRSSSDSNEKADVDQREGDGLEEKSQENDLIHRMGHAVEQQSAAVGRAARHLARQVTMAYTSYESPRAVAAPAFPPEEDAGNYSNTIDAYIDVGKLTRGQTHGAYVIKTNPQIYLETMHKNVLPLLFFSMVFVLGLTWIFSVHPTSLDATAVQVGLDSCVDDNFGENCSKFVASSSMVDGVNPQRSVTFSHPRIPSSPDMLSMDFRVENTTVFRRPGIFTLGNYTVRVSAEGAHMPLVDSYSNKLIVVCGCVDASCRPITCSDVPLVGLDLKRFDSLLFDVRKREYTVDITINPSAKFPTPPDYSLFVQVYDNPYEWAAQLVRGLIGGVSFIAIFHFLFKLSQRHVQEAAMTRQGHNRRRSAATPRMSIYERVWGHLSLERKAMVFILALLATHFNPLMIFITRASTGSPSRPYFVFRSVLETTMYTLSLGALLVILDSYRKDSRGFTNGANWRLIGWRSIAAKAIIVFGVLALRLQMTVRSEGNRVNELGNMVNYVAVIDAVLIASGFCIFFWVAMHVHRVLVAQRYSETRYLALSFRYLTIITYSTLTVFLLDVITSNGFGAVSTTKSAVLPTSSVVGEMAFAILMYFAVVAFYPPTPLRPGLIPRGYVIRERRQFMSTPKDLSPVHELSSPTSALSSPSSFSSPKPEPVVRKTDPRTSMLQRAAPFRAKPVSEPHHLFCLETACLMFNCSRHAYYRSTVNLKDDTSAEDGTVKFPASKYVNQAALTRDGLREVAHIHDEPTDTHVLVLRHASKLIFAFRGTVSKQNVKTDMEIALQEIAWLPTYDHPLLVHKGFLAAYETVRERCHAIFESLHHDHHAADSYVYCTGHSLGGALATLAAIDFKCNLKKPTIMYNYGSPRVGTHSFHHFFNGHVPLAFRIVNEGDLVCGVPQRLTMSCGRYKRLYKHVGTEVVMDGKTNGDFIIRPSFAEKNLIVEVRKKPGRHYLKGYKENLDVIIDGVLRSEMSLGEFRQQTALERALYGLDTLDEDDFVYMDSGSLDNFV